MRYPDDELDTDTLENERGQVMLSSGGNPVSGNLENRPATHMCSVSTSDVGMRTLRLGRRSEVSTNG
jgi:hypothetical protein